MWSDAYRDRSGSGVTASFTQIKATAANEGAERKVRETRALIRGTEARIKDKLKRRGGFECEW